MQTYPTTGVSVLSEDALTLYRYGVERGGNAMLNGDPFDPKARYSHGAKAGDYAPSERVLAAAQELEQHSLGSLDTKYCTILHVTPVAKNYTVANGRGSYFAQVWVSETPIRSSGEGRLLATLVGARLEECPDQGRGPGTLNVEVLHKTATDVEHDTARVARIVITCPEVRLSAWGTSVEVNGVLMEHAHLYPLGQDPTEHEGDQDTRTGTCTSEYCEKSHPFAPYIPPEVQTRGLYVQVVAQPMTGVEVMENDLP